jgi:hypothetical protein
MDRSSRRTSCTIWSLLCSSWGWAASSCATRTGPRRFTAVTNPNDLRSARFFDVKNFPAIRFRGSGGSKVAISVWTVSGDLTIRHVTHPITLEVTVRGARPDAHGQVKVGLTATARATRVDVLARRPRSSAPAATTITSARTPGEAAALRRPRPEPHRFGMRRSGCLTQRIEIA